VILRPYQTAAIEELRAKVRSGCRRVLLVAPTGSGKTVLFSEIIRSFRERSGGNAIIIVHRRELVDQTLEKLAAVGVLAGVVMASDRRASDDPVQVCSIQTLIRRKSKLPKADLIIYDEAHHAAASSSREVLGLYPEAMVFGFTATPWRSDKLGLSDIFEDHVVATTPAELIAMGALSRYDAFAYDAPDLHEVGTVAGDYNQKDLGLACNTSVLVGACVSEYARHASGRPTIVFPVNVEHSKNLVAEFHGASFSAAHIDWSTPATERAATIEAFKRGSLQVLSSVGVLTEGFDAPSAEVCILARPTKSLSLYIQMAGRVLRPHPGKTALIHDHGGNLFRHGLPDDDRDYSPRATSQRVRELMSCTDCGYLAIRWTPDGKCPKCGSLQQMPAEERAASERRKGKEFIEGTRVDMATIKRLRAEFEERGRKISTEQALRIAQATREEKAAEYLRLVGVAQRKGFQKGFIGHQYRATFGVWPRFREDELQNVRPALYPFLPLLPRRDDAP
jgi:DNA repair protein RadD